MTRAPRLPRPKPPPCSEPKDCPSARDAAQEAVREVFATLGVDVNNPKDVEEFRKDLRFGGELRKLAGHGRLAMVGVLAASLLAAAWIGLLDYLGGPRP